MKDLSTLGSLASVFGLAVALSGAQRLGLTATLALLALAAVGLGLVLYLALIRKASSELRSVRLDLPPGIAPDDLVFRDPDGHAWSPESGGSPILRVPEQLHGCYLFPEHRKQERMFTEVRLDLSERSRMPVIRIR